MPRDEIKPAPSKKSSGPVSTVVSGIPSAPGPSGQLINSSGGLTLVTPGGSGTIDHLTGVQTTAGVDPNQQLQYYLQLAQQQQQQQQAAAHTGQIPVLTLYSPQIGSTHGGTATQIISPQQLINQHLIQTAVHQQHQQSSSGTAVANSGLQISTAPVASDATDGPPSSQPQILSTSGATGTPRMILLNSFQQQITAALNNCNSNTPNNSSAGTSSTTTTIRTSDGHDISISKQ